MKGIEGCAGPAPSRAASFRPAHSRPAPSRPAPSRLALLMLVLPLLASVSLALLAFPPGALAQERRAVEARVQEEEVRRLMEERAVEARLRAEELRRLMEEQAVETRLRAEELRLQAEEMRRVSREQAQEMRSQALEMRAQARDLARELQQVVIRAHGTARMGVELDRDQGPEYDRQGVRVKGLLAGSPAEKAGLRKDDIITHLNGWSLVEPLPDPEREAGLNRSESLPVQRLMELVGKLERGDEVEVRFLREGRRETLSFEVEDVAGRRGVTILPRELFVREGVVRIPDFRLDSLRGGVLRFGPELRLDTLRGGVLRGFALGDPQERFLGVFYGRTVRGLELREMNPDLAPYFSTDRGVLVLEADEDRELGLRPGDVILSIGDRDVENVRDARRILSSYREGEGVTFLVMRQGRQTRVEGRMD